MNILTVTLEQHTPLIHFHPNQYGATLRASEVKPLLDKYIINSLSKEDYKKGVEEGWIKEKEGNRWLDYRMSIVSGTENGTKDLNTYEMNKPNGKKHFSKKHKKEIPNLENYPLFFANMDLDYNDDRAIFKELKFIDYLCMTLLSKSMPIKYIFTKELLCNFFLTHNFGSRKSKGFGSFYVSCDDELYVKPRTKYWFEIKEEYNPDSSAQFFNKVFSNIELFYKTLRGGINLKNKHKDTVFYFKSLAYMYAKDKLNAHWDKKFIKNNLLKLDDNDGKENNTIYYDIRDLLGYSTSEQWLSYYETIEKKTPKIEKEEFQFPSEKDKLLADRMESPIMFKPFITGNGCKVLILFQDDKVGLSKFKDIQKIFIYSKKDKALIDLPQEFTSESYFKFIFEELKLDVSEHVKKEFHNTKEFKILDSIYNQIKENLE